MRFIKDKEVLLSVWNAYVRLERLKIHLDDPHNKEKYEESKKELQFGKEEAAPMYDFYASPNGHTFDLLNICNIAKSALEKAIAKIEKEL
jgi:hypothetical protein